MSDCACVCDGQFQKKSFDIEEVFVFWSSDFGFWFLVNGFLFMFFFVDPSVGPAGELMGVPMCAQQQQHTHTHRGLKS